MQTVWLLLAALLNGALFFTDIFSASTTNNGVTVSYAMRVNSAGNYSLLIAALAIIIIPFIAIFMFRNRKTQRNTIMGAIISTSGFLTLMQMRISTVNASPNPPVNGHYGVGAVLPIFALACLVLAIRGVIKDDKLVKSVDRLR